MCGGKNVIHAWSDRGYNFEWTQNGGPERFQFRVVCLNDPGTYENKSNVDGPERLNFKAIWVHQILKEGRQFGKLVQRLNLKRTFCIQIMAH